MKRFPGILTSALALLLLVSVAGCETSPPQQANTSQIRAVAVKTVTAAQTDVARSTEQPATVLPFFETQLRARATGYVIELPADIGDVVAAGEVLAVLDVPELDQQKVTLQARLALLDAEEKGASAGVDLATASVESARAKLEQAKSLRAGVEASLAAAEAEFTRTEDLVNRGSLQNRMLDEARKKRDTEVANRDAVASAVSAADAEVGVAEAEKAAAVARQLVAQANTEVAKSELEELNVQLSFAKVTAPFAGTITKREVEMGDLVQSGGSSNSTSLFVLSQIDKVRVQIPVPENDAPFIAPGDAISLRFPAFESEPAMDATVTRRSGSLHPSTRTMVVEAEIENPEQKLLPGMFGQATIDLETKVARTTLPSRAVRFDESGRAFVYVLDQDNKVNLIDVTAGWDNGNEIEILSGLQPGDRVIGPHLQRFSDGQQVQPL